MVDHIRPAGRVGAVITPTRPRKPKRDRYRGDQHQQPEEERTDGNSADREGSPAATLADASEAPAPADRKMAGRGGRIDVVI